MAKVIAKDKKENKKQVFKSKNGRVTVTKSTKVVSKKRSSSNVFLDTILKPFKFIGIEAMQFIKGLGLGVFTFFDFLFTYLFTFTLFIGYGIKAMFKFLWDNIFILIYREVSLFFKAIFNGTTFAIEYVFYEGPRYVVVKISTFFYNIYSKIKRYLELHKKEEKPKRRISDYFRGKWESLEIVKQQKMKRESQLVLMEIDKMGDDAKRNEVKLTYKYLARSKEGKLVKGYFAALSKLDVYSYLLDEGYQVYEIKTSWWINFAHGPSRGLKSKMKNKDLIFWLAQLSTYVKSGIPLTDSVKILAKQDKRKRYKSVYDSVIYELTMGESFSESLRKQGAVFPGLLINMIKAAELIGDIEGTLDEMSDYYKQMEETRKAMIAALTYPTIILVFAVGVVTFIMLYIIPKFVDVYNSIGTELNPMTLAVLNFSNFMQENIIMLVAIVVGGIFIFRLLYRNLKPFRGMFQYVLMHMPFIGKVIIFKEMGLFSKTFATLNRNNILLTDSIDILSKITNNEIYKTIMLHTIANLLKGDKMSESFKKNWAVPELAYYMIATGEATGELASMLEKISEYYNFEQKNMVNMVKTFIEPIMIVILAVIVGFIILAILIPMFGLYTQIQ